MDVGSCGCVVWVCVDEAVTVKWMWLGGSSVGILYFMCFFSGVLVGGGGQGKEGRKEGRKGV